MTTKADELKARMAQLDANIEAQRVLRDARFERVKLIDEFIAQLERRRLTLQAQLEREDTVLVKPQPTGVKAGCFDI